MARFFCAVVMLILLAGCAMKRDCIIDAQGRKMCEEWQAATPNVVVVVPANEPAYVYQYLCDDPYDPRCKVQLGGGGPSISISGGGGGSFGDPNRGQFFDYYPYRDRRTGKVKQGYGPVGGGGWRNRYRGW